MSHSSLISAVSHYNDEVKKQETMMVVRTKWKMLLMICVLARSASREELIGRLIRTSPILESEEAGQHKPVF